MSFFERVNISGADSPTIDAFGRIRISTPYTLFDSKLLVGKSALKWVESVTGAGASSDYNTNQSSVTLSVPVTTASSVVRQTRSRFNYQPGKALKNGEPVLTPHGWVAIEELSVGDIVFDGNGKLTRVIGVYPQGKRTIYRITFSDNTHVDSDGEHLWKTIIRQNSKKGEFRIITTNQMLAEYGERPPVFARWRIPSSPVLNIDTRPVDIDPYTLGAILGDGHIYKKNDFVGFTSADKEIVDNLKCVIKKYSSQYQYGICGLQPAIRKYGLCKRSSCDKFIPDDYKFNSKDVRLEILRGLMDTDGTVDKRCGVVEFSSASKQLAEDVDFLVRSLGGQTKIKSKKTYYKDDDGNKVECLISYRVSIIMSECPFRLERKAFYWKPRTRISFDKYIHSIVPIGEFNATCIRVESDDHTFLTRGHTVTHNSQLIFITGVIGAAAAGITKRVGYFDEKNGIFIQQTNAAVSWVKRSYTSGAAVDTTVTQANWNLDTMDGNGPSGVTLDFTKTQIFMIDLEWLGVGRVRIGFVIDGIPVYCHQFVHANIETIVYMSSPNLPVRFQIDNDGTGAASTLTSICTSVISEGGSEYGSALRFAADRGSSGYATIHPLISVRLKSTELSRTIIFEELSVMCGTTGSFRFALYLNPTIAGVDAAIWQSQGGSSLEYDINRTTSNTISGGTLLFSDYGSSQVSLTDARLTDIHIGSTVAGVSDEIVLTVQNTPAAVETYYASMNWREVS